MSEIRVKFGWLAGLLLLAALWAGGCDRKADETAVVQNWSREGKLGGLTIREHERLRPAPGAAVTLTVVATGDLKGRLTSALLHPHRRRPEGLAYLAPLIAGLRRDDPGLILLDAGDALNGPLAALGEPASPRLPILKVMRLLAFDAAVLGNFDLSLPPEALDGALENAAFPWLSANWERADGGTVLAPYHVLVRHGVRVAVLGLTTPRATTHLPPGRLRGGRLGGMEAAARRWLPVLRRIERADVVIGLFHDGLDGGFDRGAVLRTPEALGGEAGRIASQGLGFDLIVSGDAHRLAPRRGQADPGAFAVPVLEAGNRGNGLALARLRLTENKGRWRVTGVRRETLFARAQPDAALLDEVGEDLRQIRALLDAPSAARFRRRVRKSEFYRCAGALSHSVAAGLDGRIAGTAAAAGDAGAALSLLPMRWRFPRGPRPTPGDPLRRADLYRWMPFAETLVLARLTGRQIELLLEGYVRHLRGWRVWGGAVLWPGGLRVEVVEKGSEITALRRRDNGAALRPHDFYRVWLTDFVWRGGGGLAPRALIGPEQQIGAAPVVLREAIFKRLSQPGVALPLQCGRWLES